MALNKQINARQQQKHDIEANWILAGNNGFVPLNGEIIVYDKDDNYDFQRVKIGDGVTDVNALKFVNQADWNASEGEPGHVLNRTHYTESGMVEVLEPSSHTPEGGNNDLYVDRMLGLVGGETYIVNWNGTEYKCTANAVSESGVSSVTLGYMPLGNEEENVNGYPFGVVDATIAGLVMTYVRTYDENPFTVSIYHDAETVHKLDHKYLPEGVPYCIEGDMVEVLPGFSVTVTEENDGFFFITEPFSVTIGESYIVNWNGTEYKVTAADSAILNEEMAGVPLLMNEGVDFNTGSGLVFAIVCMGSDGTYGQVIVGDGSTSVTLSIYQGGAEIRKLDGRCLPNGVPYIEGEGTMKTILAETTFTGIGSLDAPLLADYIPLTANTTYIVNWNGTEYTCVSRILSDNGGSIGIGNLSYLGGTGNNEPFGIASGYFDDSQSSLLISNDGTTEATISIGQNEIVFHKIDKRLLPESAPPINSNLVNGSADGSLRSIGSMEEDSEYTIGEYAFAEGYNTEASGGNSHAEGSYTTASGESSHAEGSNTYATGAHSHAEGYHTEAEGSSSHTEGYFTKASGDYSHAEGYNTNAVGNYSHVQGKWNIWDSSERYAHIVGNGIDNTTLSNAYTLDWDGNAWFAGDVYVGSTSKTNKDEGSKKLVAAPTDAVAGDLLMYDGTNWVKLSKADLIAEIIAALPSAEEASF